jgi:hypothetical protein
MRHTQLSQLDSSNRRLGSYRDTRLAFVSVRHVQLTKAPAKHVGNGPGSAFALSHAYDDALGPISVSQHD